MQMKAIEYFWLYVNIGLYNGLVPPGNKLLPELMLTNIMSPYGHND